MKRHSTAFDVRLSTLMLLVACAGKPETPPAAAVTEAIPPRPSDSLVLTTRQGVEVWFTDSRPAKDSAGGACTERVMQIRRDGRKVAVPLLYTGSAPKLVNDTTIEAPIWLNCRPGNVYQVDLKTGRPVRVK